MNSNLSIPLHAKLAAKRILNGPRGQLLRQGLANAGITNPLAQLFAVTRYVSRNVKRSDLKKLNLPDLMKVLVDQHLQKNSQGKSIAQQIDNIEATLPPVNPSEDTELIDALEMLALFTRIYDNKTKNTNDLEDLLNKLQTDNNSDILKEQKEQNEHLKKNWNAAPPITDHDTFKFIFNDNPSKRDNLITLELDPEQEYSYNQIKNQWKKLALPNHPDKLGPNISMDNKEKAINKFNTYTNAYKLLLEESLNPQDNINFPELTNTITGGKKKYKHIIKPRDPQLYNKTKKQIYNKIKKHSAYRSGLLVQTYKKKFKKKYGNKNPYIGQKNLNNGLGRWFREDWKNQRGSIGYKYKNDIYRPTNKITIKTPKTFSELSKKRIKKARTIKYRKGRVYRF